MKHWLWYKTDGEIGGEIVRQDGWGAEDLDDSESTDPIVVGLRATYTAMDGFAGFISFTCGDASGFCDCAWHRVISQRVDTGGPTLEDKPTYTIKVDAVTVNNGDTIDKTPGTDVDVHLEGSIGDGVVVDISNGGGVDVLQTSPQQLTFVSGTTNTVTIKAPTAGATGGVGLTPQNKKDAALGWFKVRGW